MFRDLYFEIPVHFPVCQLSIPVHFTPCLISLIGFTWSTPCMSSTSSRITFPECLPLFRGQRSTPIYLCWLFWLDFGPCLLDLPFCLFELIGSVSLILFFCSDLPFWLLGLGMLLGFSAFFILALNILAWVLYLDSALWTGFVSWLSVLDFKKRVLDCDSTQLFNARLCK